LSKNKFLAAFTSLKGKNYLSNDFFLIDKTGISHWVSGLDNRIGDQEL